MRVVIKKPLIEVIVEEIYRIKALGQEVDHIELTLSEVRKLISGYSIIEDESCRGMTELMGYPVKIVKE